MNKQVYLATASLILMSVLATAAISPESATISPTQKAVLLGTNVNLHIESSEINNDWTFQWSAQRGNIVGSGSSAVYSAPSGITPGYDVVSVTISDGAGSSVTEHAAMLLYKQFIILKAEDYVCWDYLSDNWKYYFQYMAQRGIKTSAGLITESIEPSWNVLPGYHEYVQYTKDRHASGLVEFWHSGYDRAHGDGWYEFSGTTYEFQKAHLETGQALAQTVLGFPLTAFAAPYSAYDAVTTRAIDESDKMEMWMFASNTGSTKVTVPRVGGEIEASAGTPSYVKFLATYGPSRPCVILQHHPAWQSFRDNYSQFEQILDHLIGQKVFFVTPTEYARAITRGIFPLTPGVDTDDDGLTDVLEGQGDADHDGLPDFLDDTGPNPNPNPALIVTANSVALHPGDTTNLTVGPQAALDPAWSYTWSVSLGTITPNGSRAVYYAPQRTDPTNITVTVAVTDNDEMIGTYERPLLLYNQLVMLKADDWVRDPDYYMGIGLRWDAYVDYLKSRGIKASLGLIARSLEPDYPYPGDNQFTEFVTYSKNAYSTGLFDFFNHGYDHSGDGSSAEFWNMPYEFQKERLENCNAMAKQVLGITLRAFAAPFNAIDDITARVVDESQDTQVWVFNAPYTSQKITLERAAGEVEPYTTGDPNFEGFLQGYDPNANYAVLQHHPNSPLFEQHFDQFKEIIDYLVNRKVTFITFAEYYRLIHDKIVPSAPGGEADSDGDGIPDSVEGTGDSDGDGIPNHLDPDVRPSITAQPAGGTITEGQPFTFQVAASGTNPLRYQWNKDGLPIAGAMGASYAVPSATVADSGAYTVLVSNRAGDYLGNALSAPAVLVVNTSQTLKPVITLNGTSTVTVEQNSPYVDAGATAKDAAGDDITSSIVVTGAVNTSAVGVYTLTFNVTDAQGNAAAHVTRTVNVVSSAKPIITLQGSNPATVEAKTGYADAGATARDAAGNDITSRIVVAGTVNTDVIGTYTLTYSVTDIHENQADPVTRTITVVDTIKPVTTRLGKSSINVEGKSAFADAGATAQDNYDGNITANIVKTGTVNTNVLGTYTITYNVSDSSGNAATPVTRSVTVVDTQKPVITMKGKSVVTVRRNRQYVDAGATANDAFEGNITAKIVTTSKVNTSRNGTYTVKYNVKDGSGNAASQKVRYVIVY